MAKEKLLTIRIDADIHKKFFKACRMKGSTATTEIKAFIDSFLNDSNISNIDNIDSVQINTKIVDNQEIEALVAGMIEEKLTDLNLQENITRTIVKNEIDPLKNQIKDLDFTLEEEHNIAIHTKNKIDAMEKKNNALWVEYYAMKEEKEIIEKSDNQDEIKKEEKQILKARENLKVHQKAQVENIPEKKQNNDKHWLRDFEERQDKMLADLEKKARLKNPNIPLIGDYVYVTEGYCKQFPDRRAKPNTPYKVTDISYNLGEKKGYTKLNIFISKHNDRGVHNSDVIFPIQEETGYTKDKLKAMTKKELEAIARNLGIKNYRKAKKDELIDMIIKN